MRTIAAHPWLPGMLIRDVFSPDGQFREHFKRARDAGLQVTVHAGEVEGPASVWAANRERMPPAQ